MCSVHAKYREHKRQPDIAKHVKPAALNTPETPAQSPRTSLALCYGDTQLASSGAMPTKVSEDDDHDGNEDEKGE